MSNKISVAKAKFELQKIMEKLNQFDDSETIECWHVWMDDCGFDQSEQMNFVNAVQVYRDPKSNTVQMDINCYN